ncbi:helix-turn-helix transcriptional regulator [Maribacter sp. 2210JD10-5]|uniref:helix-turn-helix transcriptional regulator n=1 Tax=Maribacter sp. 2210JD10-5 TaxID=3386272 RepID=UPI0039BD595F
MSITYKDKYYDHFSKNQFTTAPYFNRDKNYLMRFNAPLENYRFDKNNLSIIFFKQGIGELHWRDRRVKIGGNKFIVTNPSNGWEYINPDKDYIDVLSFVISPQLRSQFNYFKTVSQNQLLNNPWGEIVNDSFFMENPLNASYYSSGQLLEKIHRLSRQLNFNFLCPEELAIEVLQRITQDQLKAYRLAGVIQAKKKSTQLETFKRLLTAYEYIHDNVMNPISLQDLSLESSLSKFHLYESFKAVYGKTPHQYVNRVKITKAKEFLQTGQYSIGKVSDLLGFSDLAVFSKVFKKAYGKPPSYFLA